MSYDSDVVSATGGVGEADWDKIIKLCNRIRDSVGPSSMQQAMQSVMKRVRHSNPAIQLHALTLLEACVSNCGQSFQKELTSSFFQNEVKSILQGPYSDPRVTHRLKELLVSWSSEFKSAAHMKELPKFMEQLRKEGINFTGPQVSSPHTTSHTPAPQSTHTKEEEDLRKAIQLSLQDKSTPPASSSSSPAAARPVKKEAKKVRAIYDFQAAEDNELSFRAGEIITLVDDSDENWWRGETQLSQGLFPASFVSRNLNKDPEPSKQQKKSKKTKSSGGVVSNGVASEGKKVGGVNEQKVDLLLDMLKSADVTQTSQEEDKTIQELEREVQGMRSIVEQRVQQLTAHEEGMQNISTQFNEALTLYRKLLAEGPRLSDIAQPPVVQSYSHSIPQPGMTPETHAVNHTLPQLQSGIGTQPFHQNGLRTQPQQNRMQLSGMNQPTVQPQYGMGVHMQPGMGTQPTVNAGMGIQQNGMAISMKNGTETQQLSTVYYSNPGQFAPNELMSSDLSHQPPPPSLQYQPMTMVPPQSSYAPPLYQPPVSMTTQFPLSTTQPPPPLSTTFQPPPYRPEPPPHTTQLLPQPLL